MIFKTKLIEVMSLLCLNFKDATRTLFCNEFRNEFMFLVMKLTKSQKVRIVR